MQTERQQTGGEETVDEPAVPVHEHKRQSEAVRRAITPWLSGADTLVYVLVGIVFLAGALVMLGYTVVTFIQNLDKQISGGFPQAVVTLVNNLLLVMIIMEVLRTVLSYIEEGGASLRPFLFIGAISATRRILAIGAETSLSEGKVVSREDFTRRLVDLGVNALVVLLIVFALFLLARREGNKQEERAG